MRTGFFALCLFLLAACAGPAGTSLEDGRRAYEAKQFETAFNILLPLAEGGDAEAQLMVADM